MRLTAMLGLTALLSIGALGQMTTQQKTDDFRQLVALYDKDYSFYEWKRDAIGFDLLKIQPWLDRVSASTDDIGYYEIAQQYVASLKDGHDLYLNPSDFSADLRFRVDLYDGKALVDAIDRAALPTTGFDIAVGDELVSVDGISAQDIMTDFTKFNALGSLRSTQRGSVEYATFRPQALNPKAAVVGDTAVVVLRGSDGAMKTLTIPWVKYGTFLTNIGPVPNPDARAVSRLAQRELRRKPRPRPPVSGTSATATDAQKFYQMLTQRFQYQKKPEAHIRADFTSLGNSTPVYRRALPSSFRQRLGRGDYFYSGTYTSGAYTIGLIRIPDFEASTSGATIDDLEAAVTQFGDEIGFMKLHTDGLVVDVTNNPGGYGFYALQLLDRLTNQSYYQAGFQVRPQYGDIVGLNQLLAQADGVLEPWQIDILTGYRDQLQAAYQSNRGMTGPLPIDFGWSLNPADVSSLSFKHPPVLDQDGNAVGYDKPVILLADDSSFSAAELFAGSFEDMKRGPVLGFVTGGLGGGRQDTATGIYSEAQTSVTVTRLLRANPITNATYPAAPFIENIGVQPDVTLDYMTADNLKTGGKAYVASFTAALVGLLAAK